MGYAVAQDNTAEPLLFLLVLAADHITGATSKTPTVTLSKNGGAYATPVGAITEVGNGFYKVAGNALDADTLGPLLLHATATGCDPTDEQYDIVNYDPTAFAINQGLTITPTTKYASDLCAAALSRLNKLEAGQAPAAEDAQTALDRLNEWLDASALEGLLIPNITATTWTLVSGTAAYTVGVGGTVNVARPVASGVISAVTYRDTSVSTSFERIVPLLTDEAYQRIPQKTLTSTFPIAAYYNPTYAGMLGTLTFYMVPTSTTLTGTLYAPAPLAQLASNSAIQLPPGYYRMLRDNLAVELAPDFHADIPDSLARSAAESLANVKRANTKILDVTSDAAITGPSKGISQASFYAGSF